VRVKIIVTGFDYTFFVKNLHVLISLSPPIICAQFLCLLVLCYADVFSKNYVGTGLLAPQTRRESPSADSLAHFGLPAVRALPSRRALRPG
jgi:hypothetical protein